ncbi:MAG TPA: hypothetical protein GXX29_01990 [Firmicutes bacterium]|nr:hypothetical protein [Bacillota bacterium]
MWMRFLFYGLCGWGLEIFWTGLGSLLRHDSNLTGKTYLWMFPIYGLAGLLFEPLHWRISDLAWPIRGLIWMSAIFAVEYTSGWLIRTATGQCPWDYSGVRLEVDGLIRLDYAPLWFTVGLLFELVHRTLLRLL